MVARKSRIPWRIEGNRLFAATGAFALLMLLALVASRHVATGPRSLSLGTGEVVTGVAETVTVTLNDGTVVRLAPSSRLRIGSTPGVREVWLDGRGYFAVTRLPGSRFRVRTHSGDAIVLGTRFDLLARHDDLRLVVVEGAVTVESQGTDVSAGQRQAVQVSPSMPPTLTDLDAEDVSRELDWLGNFIAFENTPLREAAEELTRHYGVTVRVLDEDLGRETVRGVFVDEELENLIPVLCRTVSAHCTISEAGVTIGP